MSPPLRIALFAPVPPAPTGIADYVADLLPLLPASWCIDVFTDGIDGATEVAFGERTVAVREHTEFAERHRDEPYDLPVYQIGNSAQHAYCDSYAVEYPGLLVLHDAVLHPSRVQTALGEYDLDPYRAKLRAGRGAVGDAVGSLVAAGLGGPALYWNFPMCEDLVRASRLTVVHGELLAVWLRAACPGARVESVVHWRAVAPASGDQIAAWRQRLDAASDVPVIASFGYIGPEHRIDLALEALAELAADHEFRVALVGSVDASLDLPARIERLDLTERVTLTGRVPASDFAAAMHATDLAINLRYPTARASSGTLVQLLQLGVVCAIHDLFHLRDLPAAAVMRVPTADRAAERNALGAHLRAWLADPQARAERRRATREWADRELRPDRMAASYREAVASALAAPAPARS